MILYTKRLGGTAPSARQAIFERDEDLQRIFASPDGLSTEALTMERYAAPRRQRCRVPGQGNVVGWWVDIVFAEKTLW
jgi:hypothetical protein